MSRVAQLLAAFAAAALIAFVVLKVNTQLDSRGGVSSVVRITAVSTLTTERVSEAIAAGSANAKATEIDTAAAKQMLSRSDWQPSALPISKGWTRQIVWARLELDNSSDAAQDVWLEVAPARLTWVALHQIGVPGLAAQEQTQTSGVAIAAKDRNIATPDIVFALRLQAREKRVVLLQAQSNTSALDFTALLHEPKEFAAQDSNFTDLLLIGGTFTLGLISLAAGLALRQPLQLLLGVRSLLISVWLLQQLGVLSLLLSAQMAVFWADQVRLAAVATLLLTTAFMWLFLISAAKPTRLPRGIHACFATLMVVAAIGALALLFNVIQSGQATLTFGILTWGTLLFTLGVSCYLVWQGRVAALTLIVTSTASLLLNSQAYLSLLGISGSVIRQFISPIPVLITTAVFFLGTTLQLAREQRERQQAEKDALNRAMLQLEGLVDERTQDLKIARDDAERANDAKSVFMAKVSHELRTPMHSLLGYVNLALREPLAESVERKLRIARRSGEQLVAQISDLMDYVRMERDQIKLSPIAFALPALCDSAEERALLLTAQGGNQLVSQRDPALPEFLWGDDARIEQIIMILLTNAMRYTQSGMVTFDVRAAATQATPADQATQAAPPRMHAVCFTVSDTGRGIKPEAMERLFDLFERGTSSDRDGMGLGLPIAKQLLGLMGSRLEISSDLGRGSRFSFTLQLAAPSADQLAMLKANNAAPAAQARAAEAAVSHTALQAAPAQSRVDKSSVSAKARRLLVLEDDPVNLQFMQDFFLSEGFDVVGASDLAQARLALDAAGVKQAFDAFVIDQRLGSGASGWDFVRDVCAKKLQQPILMISGESSDAPLDASAEMQAAVVQHLIKPVKNSAILRAVDRWLPAPQLSASPVTLAAWMQLQDIAQSGLVSKLSAWRSEHAHQQLAHSDLWPMFDALRFASIAAYAKKMQGLPDQGSEKA